MKTLSIKRAIAIGALGVILGCNALPKKDQPINSAGPRQNELGGGFIPDQPGNSYYYFTEAQLKINSGEYKTAAALTQKAIDADSDSAYLKLSLANIYLQLRDSANALKTIESILAENPNDLEALMIHARIKHGNNQLDDAAKGYEKVLAIDPKQKNIYLLLGGIYIEQGKDDAALKLYTDLVERFPRSYAGYFFIGKIHADRKKYELAEKAFQKTLEIEPNLLEPRFELIDIYKTRKDNQGVVETYQDILTAFPDNAGASIGLGYFYHSIGKKAKASQIFADLGRKSLTNNDIIAKLVQEYLDQKKYEELTVILKGMLKGAPNDSNLSYILGVAYSGIDNRNDAIHYFAQVSPDSNFYENAVVHSALIYQEMGKLSEGIEFIKAAIDKDPDNSKYYLYLGSFYEEQKNYVEAVSTLEKGIAISPQDPKLYFRLGVVYDKWDKKESSIDAMKTVIRLDSKDANALNYLGYTYADLGIQLDEAERLIREALKYRPDDGYITDSLGWVLFKRREFDKALPILKKAAELVPEDPTILEHVGDTYKELGDHDNALKYYRMSLNEQKEDTAAIREKIDALTVKNP